MKIIKRGSYLDDRPTTKLTKPVVIQNPDLKVFTKGDAQTLGDPGQSKRVTKCEFIPLEKDEQKAVVAWCRAKHVPIFASMNGVMIGGENKFAMIANLKAQGLEVGTPDLFIPIAKNGYHGLFIEVKRIKRSVVRPEQVAWIELLNKNGYKAVIAYGYQESIEYIGAYLA